VRYPAVVARASGTVARAGTGTVAAQTERSEASAAGAQPIPQGWGCAYQLTPKGGKRLYDASWFVPAFHVGIWYFCT
jgi:hypothetical protein